MAKKGFTRLGRGLRYKIFTAVTYKCNNCVDVSCLPFLYCLTIIIRVLLQESGFFKLNFFMLGSVSNQSNANACSSNITKTTTACA